MADGGIANGSVRRLQSPLIVIPQEAFAVTVVNNIPGKVVILLILPVDIFVDGVILQRALGIVTIVQIGFEKSLCVPVAS